MDRCRDVLNNYPFVAIFLMSPRDKPINTIQTSGSSFYLSPLLWLAGLILFLYVGAESSMGGWTATYMQRTTPLTAGRSALVVSGFWMALTLGRLAAAFIGARWAPLRLLTTCLIGAGVGGLMLALTTGAMIPTIIAVLLIGFFFGPIFPTTFSISASQFSQSSGKATGLIVALASLGGMSLPAIQGIVLTRFGNNPSVWLIAIYTIAMVVINFGRNGWSKKKHANLPCSCPGKIKRKGSRMKTGCLFLLFILYHQLILVTHNLFDFL